MDKYLNMPDELIEEWYIKITIHLSGITNIFFEMRKSNLPQIPNQVFILNLQQKYTLIYTIHASLSIII